MASFFFDKNRWRRVAYLGHGFLRTRDGALPRFNRTGNNRAHIRAEDQTSGRGR
jgi:hypothetical protein